MSSEGTFLGVPGFWGMPACNKASLPMPDVEEAPMNGIIYLVGLIVVIMFILSLLGLR
jgi:hypothetical protein